MKTKILLGFVAGVALTSGVFYVASKKPAQHAVETAQTVPPVAPVQPPAAAPVEATPVAAPEPAKSVPERIETVAVVTKPVMTKPPAPARVETKPSAVVRRQPAPEPPIETAAQQRTVPEPAITPEAPPEPSPAPEPVQQSPAPPEPHSVTLEAGALLTARVGQTISSDQNVAGDTFTGTLDEPLVLDGFIVAERGSRVQGRVVEADRAGRVKGVARVSVELTRIHTADGQSIPITTQAFEKIGSQSKGEDAAKIGAGAALGAIIGALAGGGKGAGIGAGIGGAAGAGTVMATRGKAAIIPVETRLSFRVQEPVTITERLQ